MRQGRCRTETSCNGKILVAGLQSFVQDWASHNRSGDVGKRGMGEVSDALVLRKRDAAAAMASV